MITKTISITRPNLDTDFDNFSRPGYAEYCAKYMSIPKEEHITYSEDMLTRTKVSIFTEENLQSHISLAIEYATDLAEVEADKLALGIVINH